MLAYTALGDGVRSAAFTCSTEEDIPDMPSHLKVVASAVDSLVISWLPSPRPTGRILHYTVFSKEVDRGQDVNSQKWTVSDQLNRLEIRNLRRRTVFYFQVAASTKAGKQS